MRTVSLLFVPSLHCKHYKYFLVIVSLSFWAKSSGQPKIIHRDIKVANILIDDNFDAKVSLNSYILVLYIYIYIYIYCWKILVSFYYYWIFVSLETVVFGSFRSFRFVCIYFWTLGISFWIAFSCCFGFLYFLFRLTHPIQHSLPVVWAKL